MTNDKEQTALSDLDEQLERNNFILWLKYASPKEIVDASKNHRKKLRYLINKYLKDSGPVERFRLSNYESN